MAAYRAWVLRNRDRLSNMESIANTMTWLLPESISSSPIALDAVSTSLGVVALVNQQLLKGASNSTVLEGATAHGVHDQSGASKIPWPFFISVIRKTESLVEKAAEHYRGKDCKWNAMATIEGVKFLIRLAILHRSGYQMLLDGGETDNNHKTDQLKGPTMQALSDWASSSIANCLLSWIRTEQVSDCSALVQYPNHGHTGHSSSCWRCWTWRQAQVAVEVMLITRPLLYVLLIKRCGLKSWRPWLSSLAIDVMGLGVHVGAASAHDPHLTLPGHVLFTQAECEELRWRRFLWGLYVMRDPFFSTWTRRYLQTVEHMMKQAPLIGGLTGKALAVIEDVQEWYTYIAAS